MYVKQPVSVNLLGSKSSMIWTVEIKGSGFVAANKTFFFLNQGGFCCYVQSCQIESIDVRVRLAIRETRWHVFHLGFANGHDDCLARRGVLESLIQLKFDCFQFVRKILECEYIIWARFPYSGSVCYCSFCLFRLCNIRLVLI